MERKSAIRRIIIFAVLSVLVIGIVVLSFWAKDKIKDLFSEIRAYSPAVTESDAFTLSSEAAETQAAESRSAGLNWNALRLPALGAAVIAGLFFLLRIPQAIRTLSAGETERTDPSAVQAPAPEAPSLLRPAEEITATEAPDGADSTTAPNTEDVPPAAGKTFAVMKTIALTEGHSLMNWEGEW